MWTLIKTFAGGALGFLGPFGMLLRPPLIYVLILVVSHGAVWIKATRVERAHCQAAELRAEVARLRLEAKSQAEADVQEKADVAELQAEKAAKEKENAALIEQIRKRPDKCLLGPDAGRL